VQRVSVVGTSGSGKSTLARELARRLGASWLELDSVYHLADWTPLDAAEFRARVAAVAAGERWVIDGNYSTVRDLVWARADTVVWLVRLTSPAAARRFLCTTDARGAL